jgi:hypothetical protein
MVRYDSCGGTEAMNRIGDAYRHYRALHPAVPILAGTAGKSLPDS